MKSIPAAPTPGANFNISRRDFLQSGAALAALAAFPALGADALDLVNGKPKRVGLIGAGWYGKSDLWRLLQVAPGEVGSICDVDQHQLAGAVEMASQRQKSGKNRAATQTFARCSRKKTLISCWSAHRTIGTRCWLSPRWSRARMCIVRSPSARM